MAFTHFEITGCTATGKVEVVGEQGTLWAGTWPRPNPGAASGRLHVVRGGYVSELHEGTGPFRPPTLRVIKGGRV